jgi:Tol biopolymer transport system component
MKRWGASIVLASLIAAAVASAGAGPKTALVSKTSAGAPADQSSSAPSVSGSGRFVAFHSAADNLPGDDLYFDIYVRDRKAGTTRLVSRTSAGDPGDGDSFRPSISRTGRFVAFDSNADNLPGDDASGNVCIHDGKTGKTRLVSKTSAGEPASGQSDDASVSATGRFVAFASDAENLPGDDLFNDVYVHDRKTGKTGLVSRTSAGAPANDHSFAPVVSASGRYVAFFSDADNLPGGDSVSNVYRHDRKTGKTRLVGEIAIGQQPEGGSYPSISGSGRLVAFGTEDEGFHDVYVHDFETGKTRLVSKTSAGVPADGSSYGPSLSGSGRYVAFASEAGNLPAEDTAYRSVYVHDRKTGKTRLASKTSSGETADEGNQLPSLSASGRIVAFSSNAENLPGAAGVTSVYVHGPLP